MSLPHSGGFEMGAFFDDGKDRRTAIARPRSSQSSRHRLPQWGRDVTRSMRLAVGVLGVNGAVGDEALLASSSTFMYVLQLDMIRIFVLCPRELVFHTAHVYY